MRFIAAAFISTTLYASGQSTDDQKPVWQTLTPRLMIFDPAFRSPKLLAEPYMADTVSKAPLILKTTPPAKKNNSDED